MQARAQVPAYLAPAIVESAQLDRHKNLLTVALDQQCNGLRVPAHHAAHLIDRIGRLAIDAEQNVARLYSGAGRRPGGLFHDQAVVELSRTALLPGQRTK